MGEIKQLTIEDAPALQEIGALKLIQILSDHIIPRKYASLFSRSLQFRKITKGIG